MTRFIRQPLSLLRPRISLKWFLLATTAIGVFSGTAGKRWYDDSQHRRYLADQEFVRQQLTALGCRVFVPNGTIVEVSWNQCKSPDDALPLLRRATHMERLHYAPMRDKDIALLKENVSLRELQIIGVEISNRSLEVIGDLANLEQVRIGPSSIDDDGLRELRGLSNLERLDLGWSNVTGRGLTDLAHLRKLKVLALSRSSITDQGLAGVGKCRSVEWLYLAMTPIDGRGLSHLAPLTKLTILDLSLTKLVHGAGFADLDNVRDLNLSEARIGKGVLRNLAEMKSLQRVNLFRTNVTDDLLAELAAATQIRQLDLMQTPVTDAGLTHLEGLKQLQLLNLNLTAVTEAGAKRLAEKLPDTCIIYPGGRFGPDPPIDPARQEFIERGRLK
jgi:Leucine-rich repeat (LRR) protein